MDAEGGEGEGRGRGGGMVQKFIARKVPQFSSWKSFGFGSFQDDNHLELLVLKGPVFVFKSDSCSKELLIRLQSM